MDRLNYNQLYYFYVVATEGSVKAACEKLHLTQPTISGQIKTLEEDLGYKLFERQHRKLVLNEVGKKILAKAEKIFVLGDELLSSLGSSTSKVRHEIRIGVVNFLPNTLVQDFTLDLWRDDTVYANIVHGSFDELLRSLDHDDIDLILSDGPYQRGKRYRSINLGNQKLIAVGSKKFVNLRKDFPHSLDHRPYLALSERGQLQQEVEYFFRMNNIKPDIIGRVDDDVFAKMMTLRGRCFTILPERSVAERVKNKYLYKLGALEQINSSFWVVTSTFGSKRIAIRRLINGYLQKNKVSS